MTTEKRGGKRPRAGRPKLGDKNHIALTLPADHWQFIDAQISESGPIKSRSDFFRQLLYSQYGHLKEQPTNEQ